MPQGGFDFNGEKYVVDSDTNPPSVWRLSAQGPVLMSTSNPGWGGPELRQKVNATLKSITPAAQATTAAPPSGAPPVSGMTLPPSGAAQAPGITVGRDPDNPDKLIWIDRQTGKPASQPGGAGTPYVDSATAAQQTPAGAAPAATPADPNAVQARILGSVGRGGWTVTGSTDEMKNQTTTDKFGVSTTAMGPTGNKVWAISGPGGKNDTVIVKPKDDTSGDFDVVNPPNNLPAGADKTFTVKGMGTYYYDQADPTTPPRLLVPEGAPNADEEMTKALERIDRQQSMTEKQANEAAGRGYQTNAEYQTMASNAARDKLGQDQLAENIRQFNAKQGLDAKQFDIKQAAQDKVDAQNILQSQAQVGSINATTAATQSTTDINKQKLPGDIAQQGATLAGTQASTAATKQSTQIAGAPQLQASSLTSPYLTQVNPLTGAVDQSGFNKAYQPKTMAEVQARAGQIKSLMDAKSAEVQGKVGQIIDGKLYTADDALKDYNAWHSAQVDPQIEGLKAAQDEALFQRGKDEAAMRSTAQQVAQGAGTLNVNAFNAMAGANPVGPNFEAASRAASKGDFGALAGVEGATNWSAPNPMDTSQAAVLQALKYIDPRAAAATGTQLPNYQSMDIGSMLGSKPYAAPGVGAGARDLMTPQQLAGLQNTTGQPGGAQVGGPAPTWNPNDIQWQNSTQNEPGRTVVGGGTIIGPNGIPISPQVTPQNVVPGSNYGNTGVPSWLANPEDIIRAQGNYWPAYSFPG